MYLILGLDLGPGGLMGMLIVLKRRCRHVNNSSRVGEEERGGKVPRWWGKLDVC